MSRQRPAGRGVTGAIELVLAAVGVWLLVAQGSTFVAPGNSLSAAPRNLRGDLTALNAEKKEGEDMGFLKFLKVEQDIELSPEEYNMALEAEIEAQRKKYYIGGVVKPNNLVVPWKPVDEKQLLKDARRALKKNGILDPAGTDTVQDDDDEEDSDIDVMLIGDEDVRIGWMGGAPGTKVGYIIERKRQQESNFAEIATYDQLKNPQLLAKQYAGHEYSYQDQTVKPGAYTYRVLVRFRSGEIQVVDQKDIVVPEAGGVDNRLAIGLLLFTTIGFAVGTYFMDPIVTK